MTYGWAIILIIIVIGALFFMGVFEPARQDYNNYHSETKAFKSEKYSCDLYLEYNNTSGISNITLLNCILRKVETTKIE